MEVPDINHTFLVILLRGSKVEINSDSKNCNEEFFNFLPAKCQ